jgi:ribosomal protein S18 acetylase RimI-like enzyme
MSAIAPLQRAHVDVAASTIARAFAADPMFEWVLPDRARRAAQMTRLNRIPLEYGLRWGRVMHSHEGRAVAIWIPPECGITVGGLIRCGMLGAPFYLGPRAFGRFISANQAMETLHNKYVHEPHWYLMIVAVDPELHGRGIGTALLQEGFAKVDASRHVCYLETSHERNVALYKRHGFTVLDRAPLGKDGPSGWAMWRPACRQARAEPQPAKV